MYIWLLVVPTASKLLFNIGEAAKIVVFLHPFTVNLTLPFSWKVFYLAAIFFTFATLLFKFRCPKLIRDHRNYDSFSAEKRPVYPAGLRENSQVKYTRFLFISWIF
jgi:hypothetical protein